MKASNYNFYYTYRHHQVVFNAISGGLLVLNEIGEKLLKKISDGHFNEKDLSQAEQSCLKEFKLGLMVLDDDFDELLYLRNVYLRTKYDPTKLGLIIAPTMACNMRCVYCFEHKEDQTGVMSDEVATAILDFAQRRLEVAKSLSVHWFGGEPLLALERICSLSKSLNEIALQKGATYSSLMVSNGTLLTKDTAEKLADAKIRNVQITIDGYGEAHDSRRKLKSGERSFDKIMKNIMDSCGIINIAIRMGIDKENTEGIVLLLKELARANLKERVGIYFAPIISDVTPCFNYAEKTMSREGYGKAYLRTIETARELGYELTQISPFPPPVPIGCGHQSLSLITIDPQGVSAKIV